MDSREPHDSWGGGIVSCSDDYDDDIKKNESAISDLSSQLTALQTALEQAKSDAQAAHAKFVTQTELNNVEAAAKAAAQEAAATAKAEALSEAINQCKALIAGKADQSALDALSSKVNAIDATLNKLGDVATKSDLDAAKQNLQNQINALNYLKDILPQGTDFEKIIKELATLKAELEEAQKKLESMNPGDVSELKTMMNNLSNKVNAFDADINMLTVLVNKMLTSVTLVPELYSDGIEAVSFDYLAYYPVVAGTSGNTLVANAKLQRIDKGETVIKYRLNPTTVELSSIDVDNIGFVGHTAKKQDPASRAAEQSPILFQSIAENGYQNGVLSVQAKRNPAVDLSATGDDNVWVAAIKVPRKADVANGVEYAEIYSEYSMVLEQTFTPQIAAVNLSAKGTTGVSLINGKKAYGFDGKALNIKEVLAGINDQDWSATENHYYNKNFLYETAVDADSYVTIEIPFNETFDLAQLVTGCKTRNYPDRPQSSHYQITREELASYGLNLVFSIPTEEYLENVDNKTNQQEFAKIKEDGKTIISKTPAGLEQNEAVIGKEPIVMVQLIDVNNNKNIVDERYFKIKWADDAPEAPEEQKTVTLEGYSKTVVLNPCGEMNVAGITWREFVNNVYAQIGDNGMSQADFEEYYPEANRVVKSNGWSLYHAEGNLFGNGSYDGSLPKIVTTTNEHGDALVANWKITADDVERVICDNTDAAKAVNNFKTISTTITMTPTEKRLPILVFNYDVKVTVPNLPSLVGYYDQYWFEKYNTVDVLPVQYNTPAQLNGNFYGTGKYDYCVYDFNLTNAFVYEQVNNQTKYIVKDITTCGSYDIQFRKSQAMNGWGSPVYTNEWTNNNEPAPATEIWNKFAGYQLNKGTANALQMYWVSVAGSQDYKAMSTPVEYESWDLSNANWRSAKIFADSQKKTALAGLLNPLSQDNEVSELGQKQPVRTHDKKVNMGIWSRLNDFNYILVKAYDLCLVAPLRVDALSHDGAFEDGHVSGTSVTFDQIFSMTDFRGYLVAQAPTKDIMAQYTEEQAKYGPQLYEYYQVEEPTVNTDAVTYNFKVVNGTVQIDTTQKSWMTAAELYRLTNGNLNFSIEKSQDGKTLTFFNNGGSNIEAMCYAKIPCSVEYGFGSASTDILVPIYPHGSNN